MKRMRILTALLGLALAAGAGDLTIQSFNGTVSVSAASCFYRVVASVTNAVPPVTDGIYLVVDLSGGPSASSYPSR